MLSPLVFKDCDNVRDCLIVPACHHQVVDMHGYVVCVGEIVCVNRWGVCVYVFVCGGVVSDVDDLMMKRYDEKHITVVIAILQDKYGDIKTATVDNLSYVIWERRCTD